VHRVLAAHGSRPWRFQLCGLISATQAATRKICRRKAQSTNYDYFDLWTYDGTLVRIHYALYARCREQEQREASPTAVIIDSQRMKSAEKGGPASIRAATMRARTSRARNGIFSSIS